MQGIEGEEQEAAKEVRESRHEGTSLSEEVSGTGTPEKCGDEEEEDMMHPGEVSVGKKLWRFLTT